MNIGKKNNLLKMLHQLVISPFVVIQLEKKFLYV